jgi:hypothetical protein
MQIRLSLYSNSAKFLQNVIHFWSNHVKLGCLMILWRAMEDQKKL